MWKPSTTPNDVLMHSAKGSSWKKHKYIRKEGNKYIYPHGKLATERGWREKVGKDNLTDAEKTAVQAQKRGFQRTLEEKDKELKKAGFTPLKGESLSKNIYDNEKKYTLKDFAEKDLQAKKAVRAAQEAGKKRTEYEKYKNAKAIGAYHTDGSRLADKHMNLAKAANVAANSGYSKGYQTNMEKARQASNVYRGGLARENNDRANTTAYGGDRKSSHSTKVINPTAKKNQQKAKIEKAKYKVKSAINKLKNKLVTEETTVTDAYTGKKRKTNMKANYKKSKKKIRIKK